MRLESRDKNNWQVVLLTEKNLDAANSEDFKTDMEGMIANNPFVVLDLKNTEFLDSSGCGALLTAYRQAADCGGELRLCCVQDTVASLFELLKLNQVIDVYDSSEQATG